MTAFSNLDNKLKILLGVIALVVILEVVWVGWVLSQPRINLPAIPGTENGFSQSTGMDEQSLGDAILSLSTPKESFRVGEVIPVTITIQSDKQTDGTDVIVLYDPNLLSVQKVSTTSAILMGSIYTDVPINIVDEQAGRITVSGVTSNTTGVVPNGIFGTINFVAKAAGNAKVSFDFIPGSTIDTNITQTQTAKDVLGKVNNLEVNITQ